MTCLYFFPYGRVLDLKCNALGHGYRISTMACKTHTHRRMGTLWLGGAEGLIAQNFTQITGADTGFPEPPLLDIHKHPPLVRVTSSALRKIEKHPPPTIAAAQKRTAAAQKTELPKSWGGGAAAPLPPRLIRLCPYVPTRPDPTRPDPTYVPDSATWSILT